MRGRDSEASRVTRVATLISTVLLVSAGYYVGGLIGIALRFPPSGIATIWPPTAILVSALLLTPPRSWWVYLLAAVPTHMHLVAYFQPDVPPVVMFAQVGSNALHAVLAAVAVRNAVGTPTRFDSLRSMVLYILYAAIGATVVACALAVSVFALTGWAADFWLAFRQRVLANVFAIITIPPLIVITVTGAFGTGRYRRWPLYAELGLLTVALLVVGVLVFGREAPASANVPALLLTPMPLLLWAAVRLGPGGLCFCLLVVAGLSLSNAFAGRGPFVTASPADNTLSLQVFLLAVSAPLMILAAIVQERRRVDDEARVEREELAHVLRVATLGELTTSIAHEISQPLAAIAANAQAARNMLPPAPVQEVLGDITAEANRGLQIIQRLRALFRKEHESRILVDVNALIENMIALLRADMERRRIAVRFAPGEALPAILGDVVLLQQVVLNVVINACDAIDATAVGPRTILIETTGVDGHVAIAVRDTGIGVQESELQRIFEQFVSSKPQGLGMGLAISRSIIKAHGGRIWATANADMGLTMHVDLPGRGTK